MTTLARNPYPYVLEWDSLPELAYLASPYSHIDPEIRHFRYQYTVVAVAHLLHEGIFVYSPILHNHPVACFNGSGRGMGFWMPFDFAILGRCSKLVVLTLDGWADSEGVTIERHRALKLGIPIEYMTPVPIPDEFTDFQVRE